MTYFKDKYYQFNNKRSNFYLHISSTGEAYIRRKPSQWPKLIKLAYKLNILAFIITMICLYISYYVS